jgi:hypothetical protein
MMELRQRRKKTNMQFICTDYFRCLHPAITLFSIDSGAVGGVGRWGGDNKFMEIKQNKIFFLALAI